jgi:hypothetical protein
MRFERVPRYEPLRWTSRKQALALSRPLRQAERLRKALPLLADQIEAEGVVDVDQEQVERQARLSRIEREQRAFVARVWRASRADYFGASAAVRAAIQAHWRAWRGPVTCLYFRYVVDLHTGALEARTRAMREREAAARDQVLRQLDAQRELPLAG